MRPPRASHTTQAPVAEGHDTGICVVLVGARAQGDDGTPTATEIDACLGSRTVA